MEDQAVGFVNELLRAERIFTLIFLGVLFWIGRTLWPDVYDLAKAYTMESLNVKIQALHVEEKRYEQLLDFTEEQKMLYQSLLNQIATLTSKIEHLAEKTEACGLMLPEIDKKASQLKSTLDNQNRLIDWTLNHIVQDEYEQFKREVKEVDNE